jgi:hypothetical protein
VDDLEISSTPTLGFHPVFRWGWASGNRQPKPNPRRPMNPLQSLIVPAAIAIAAAAVSSPLQAQVAAYHDQDGNQHQQQYNLLSAQGYRMTSLSIYGTPQSPLYAAVWILRNGPHYAACHGVDAAGYQDFVNTWWPLGYRPRLLSATGNFGNERFAAVFERTNAPGSANHGLTEQEFWDARNAAAALGQDVLAVDIYGAANDPRYIVGFGPVNAGQAEVVSSGVSGYQTHFDALMDGHARPTLVAFNDHNRFVSLWQSNEVGHWVAHHDMTSAQYQQRFDQYALQNMYPITVQASGQWCWAPLCGGVCRDRHSADAAVHCHRHRSAAVFGV